jgi:hypothetical protein
MMRGTDQVSERDLLCWPLCALWGLYGVDGRDTRFGGDGVEGFVEVVFKVKVKRKGRHRENSERRIYTALYTAATLGLELSYCKSLNIQTHLM